LVLVDNNSFERTKYLWISQENKWIKPAQSPILTMSDGPGRAPEITDEEIINVFHSSSDPVLTTSEVASEFEITHRGVRDRLEKLEKKGSLESKKVGARAIVWWIPE
jgi:predicted HTH transcriptional regulator